ncbi:MAG: PIN domain-containing protein [Planctomycetaceae bacterium]
MKVLIDANVVLDVLLNRTPWVAESRAVWDANHRQQIHGYVVATTLTNIFYVARRLVGFSLAMQGVRACLAAFHVLPVDGNALNEATNLAGSDFEDNVTIRCAANFQVDVIVTRNLADFSQSPIPAVLPGDLIARINSSGV